MERQTKGSIVVLIVVITLPMISEAHEMEHREHGCCMEGVHGPGHLAMEGVRQC